ncbi:MAG: hypothetical protein COV91_01590 [Candidatus Taylorbacteria bacterium CG11_big_fil_rev_8_21_14_0_20_46_11]|uniref:Peptidase M23 domain-containing protein n=1 Tax=Candidatus Taylorbacteria bacterium CG11_big_fil_rev_8_21_14_0_20_46_11 TaxID=1975025 RepID=A0A2H0KCD8_9BACT|nr:MAG: hypothetical protein COV91_01590 [Candidatus Taylorbacteria bacterium CG11_big_fil_rev_8_21_14_0_20_46_11]
MSKIYVIGVLILGVVGGFLLLKEREYVPTLPNVEKKSESFEVAEIKKKEETPSVKEQSPKSESVVNTNTPPILLKNIGINLDDYNPATQRAGDFQFTKARLTFGRLFMPYGFVIPGSTSSTGRDKANPQPTFIVPLGTPVRSLVDGIVVSTPTLWSGDVSIQVTANGKLEKWVYETEHVMNPRVKAGDRVTAGQIVGEVSNFDKGAPDGYGAVEIGIVKGGNPPEHVCPFAYLDPSIKEETLKKISSLYSAWESYVGNTSLYSESEPVVGCITLDAIEG